MKPQTQRTILFFTLLSIFIVTAVIVLLSVAGSSLVHVAEDYKRWMFSILIVEAVASIFAYWKQLNGGGFLEPPKVDGRWEYECIRNDETYKHGGICEIKVHRAEFGWEFAISGQRTWIATSDMNKNWIRRDLEACPSWDNTWGTFTGKDSLRYAYSINTGVNVVNGYGTATMRNRKDGVVERMEGNFYQLPPHDAFYGSQCYWRAK